MLDITIPVYTDLLGHVECTETDRGGLPHLNKAHNMTECILQTRGTKWIPGRTKGSNPRERHLAFGALIVLEEGIQQSRVRLQYVHHWYCL